MQQVKEEEALSVGELFQFVLHEAKTSYPDVMLHATSLFHQIDELNILKTPIRSFSDFLKIYPEIVAESKKVLGVEKHNFFTEHECLIKMFVWNVIKQLL
jgi:hypothetical protein